MTALDDLLARRKQQRAAKREQEQIDKRVERAYYARCSGIQIDIMDIGNVFKVGRDFLAANPGVADDQLAEAVFRFVQSIRKN